MSANQSEISQPHRIHPNSLANLRPFEKGESGNPGGFPQSVRYDVAYKKLSAMSEVEFSKFKPTSKAERVAYETIRRAEKKTLPWAQAANKAAEIVADRVDGKPEQHKTIDRRTVEVKINLAVNESVEFASKLGLQIDPARAAQLLELIAGAREEAE